ncbi:MAG: hypothetical protein ACYSRQ_04115, partial [Planctomycetota bacterium]
RKALVFEKTKEDMKCNFEIEPGESVLINPAVTIKDWGAWPFVKIMMNGSELSKEQYKLGQEGDELMMWIPAEIRDKSSIMIEGLGEPYYDD